MLKPCDAVAAIILGEDGRFLLQHRDERPDIWYPGHWGCFGGAVDAGESPEQALRRELYEELEYRPACLEYVVRFSYDVDGLEAGSIYRMYYLARLSAAEEAGLRLHEGQAMRAFPLEELERDLRLTPYDAFALRLFSLREPAAALSP